MLVSDIINRLYREYLWPAADQPSRGILTSDINSSVTTVPITTTIMAPEEVDLLGAGAVVEIDSELLLVTAFTSPNLTVVRGWSNTEAAAHTAGAQITLSPEFSRKQVFDAVADAVADLYPDLYSVSTETVTTSEEPIPIDSRIIEIHQALVQHGSKWQPAKARLLRNFPDHESGVAVQFEDVGPGMTAILTTFSSFPRPTSETDDLGSDFGPWRLDEGMVKIIMVDALAGLVSSRQMDKLTLDHITDLIVNEGFSMSDLRQVIVSMLQLRAAWVDRARKRLNSSTNIRIAMRR